MLTECPSDNTCMFDCNDEVASITNGNLKIAVNHYGKQYRIFYFWVGDDGTETEIGWVNGSIAQCENGEWTLEPDYDDECGWQADEDDFTEEMSVKLGMEIAEHDASEIWMEVIAGEVYAYRENALGWQEQLEYRHNRSNRKHWTFPSLTEALEYWGDPEEWDKKYAEDALAALDGWNELDR